MMPPIAVHVHLPAHMLLPDARCASAPDGRASDALEDLDGRRPCEPFRRDDEPEWLTRAQSQLKAAEGASAGTTAACAGAAHVELEDFDDIADRAEGVSEILRDLTALTAGLKTSLEYAADAT